MTSIPVKEVKDFFWDQPLPFLVEQLPRLSRGRALDLAMGEGRNAVYLAQNGYIVDGVDLSSPSVRKAMDLARSRRVRVQGIVADLGQYAIRPESYDLICCFFFLERSLFPAIIRGLRPGGTLLFQSVTVDEIQINPTFPREWCLMHNELLKGFRSLRILHYEETGLENGKSHSALASLLAERELP